MDDWPQEPTGFQGLNFGATEQEIGKHFLVQWHGEIGDCRWRPDAPCQTSGTLKFSFAHANITAHLLFTQKDGLWCIQVTFPRNQFDVIKSALLSLYGPPHEESSGVHPFPEEALENLTEEQLHYYRAKFESLT